MSPTEVVIQLLGGVALLIWGMRMVRTGITRAYGATLRHLLGEAMSNRFGAFLAGLAVTILLQSSTATALMSTSFVGRGLIEVAPALAIMLGADVGTTLVAQVLSFDLGWLSPLLVLGGVILFSTRQETRRRDLGRAAIGLGLMLLALKLMVIATGPIRGAAIVPEIIAALAPEPLLLVAIAALLTWLVHSSLVMVLVVVSLAAAGIVQVPAAFALVLGANLGGAVPAFTATLASTRSARRVPLGNFLFKAAGCAAALPLLPLIAAALPLVGVDPIRQIVNFHTLFNIALAGLFLGATGPMARLAARLLPERIEPVDTGQPLYLDRTCLEMPAAALACATRETLRLGDRINVMLRKSLEALLKDDRKLVGEIARLDDEVDAVHGAIKLYLADLTRESLSDADGRRCSDVLAFTINLEHVGDIIDKSLMELVAKKIKYRLQFSAEGLAEFRTMYQRVFENLQLALGVFVSADPRAARQLLHEKERLRDLERAAAENHFKRLSAGKIETIETSAVHLDVIRDLKRINSHIVSVAYPILDASGSLRPSRLKDEASAAAAEPIPASADGGMSRPASDSP